MGPVITAARVGEHLADAGGVDQVLKVLPTAFEVIKVPIGTIDGVGD